MTNRARNYAITNGILYWITNDYVDLNIQLYSMKIMESNYHNDNTYTSFMHPNQLGTEIQKYFNENKHLNIYKAIKHGDHGLPDNFNANQEYFDTMLIVGCRDNDLETVVSNMNCGANINYIYDNAETPLMTLIYYNSSKQINFDIIYFLLSFDNINLNYVSQYGATATYAAFVTPGKMKIVEILLYNGANIHGLLLNIYNNSQDKTTPFEKSNLYKLQTIILEMIFDQDIQEELQKLLNTETNLILDLCTVIAEYTSEYVIQHNLHKCLSIIIKLIDMYP